MSDRYADARARIAEVIAEMNTGTVTLTRTTPGTPDPSTPWTPGTPTTAIYTLDARVDGVTATQIDGTTILASDLVVIASPKARAADGSSVDIVPTVADVLSIDGEPRVVKRVVAYPAAGEAALFHVFVAS